MSAIQDLKEFSYEIKDLIDVAYLLGWDQEVNMPKGSGKSRTNQISTITATIHRKFVSDDFKRLLEEAEKDQDGFTDIEKGLVRVSRRVYNQESKLPEEFVKEYSEATSQGLHIWTEAREKSDFSIFKKTLAKIIELSKRQADYLGYKTERYDALIDLYEEDALASQIEKQFEVFKREIPQILEGTAFTKTKEIKLVPPLSKENQIRFSEKCLRLIGFDLEIGREDLSVHPFTSSMGHDDIRLTNRYGNDFSFIFTAFHEGGHGLYEQGNGEELARTVLDEGISLGIHESQSRLWENIIGRSEELWEYFYPELQRTFPEQLGKVTLGDFLRSINRVKPGLIRTEADEVTYNMHIVIRFEIERDLINGKLGINDVVEVWNSKYREYLGVKVDKDSNGVLQDIHWASGGFGYFPTYSIGNLASAQIWNTYTRQNPNYREDLRSGNTSNILNWLTEKIYVHGSVYKPKALMKAVTGEEINSKYFIEYLKNKYL